MVDHERLIARGGKQQHGQDRGPHSFTTRHWANRNSAPILSPMVKFKGVLTPTPRGGGGCFVPVPDDVAAKLGLKGFPKIQAVIAGTPYRGSLMPRGDGTYCLGVMKSIQEAAGVGFGDTITVELALDTAPRIVAVPPDLAKELEKNKKAAAAWEALSYTNKKEHARALEEAKRPETRERRLAGTLEFLKSR
jgi:hypothetical protein